MNLKEKIETLCVGNPESCDDVDFLRVKDVNSAVAEYEEEINALGQQLKDINSFYLKATKELKESSIDGKLFYYGIKSNSNEYKLKDLNYYILIPKSKLKEVFRE